jgi:acyl carrier protein
LIGTRFMNKTQFIEKLGSELGISPEKLADNALLSSFPAWDSMGRMAVVAMLDTDLALELPQGALQKCETVADLVALVANKLQP